MPRDPILVVRGLSATYGPIRALSDVDLDVAEGEIVAILGSNGAGKTTTLLAITGLIRPTAGQVTFRGRDITGTATETIVRLGLAMTPEGRHIFEGLTVVENLRMGAAFRGRAAFERMRDEVFALFPVLAERRAQLGGTLSGGEQQMLAIGRSMMSEPAMLLLDEPSLGLAPQIVEVIFDLIVRLRDRGTTILLVEQNARLALDIADRGFVIASGRVVATGTGRDLLASDEIVQAYLGVE